MGGTLSVTCKHFNWYLILHKGYYISENVYINQVLKSKPISNILGSWLFKRILWLNIFLKKRILL